jgi:3-hydroxyisobutyrate dehydrogenase-like beta-hydroxyacid dehydrogenase
VHDAGGEYVEAPVVGSRPQLAARALVTLLGGTAEAADRAAGVVSAYSSRVEHVGPVGTAGALKLSVNAMLAAQTAAVADVLRVLASQHVGPQGVEVLTSLASCRRPRLGCWG